MEAQEQLPLALIRVQVPGVSPSDADASGQPEQADRDLLIAVGPVGLHVGDEFKGWMIVEITSRSVLVEKNGKQFELE